MNLINKKTLARHLNDAPIPADHHTRLLAWEDLIKSRRIYDLKETSLHGQFTSSIIEGVLGYRGAAKSSIYTVSTEQSILRGSVDLALGRFGEGVVEILAPFELKGADTRDLDAIMPGRNKTPVQQAWEYATNARGVKWVLVSNYLELRLYGFGEGTTSYELFDLGNLTNQTEYSRFCLLLSADNLLSGRTSDLLKESRQEEKDITDNLYQDYKRLRQNVINAIRISATEISPLKAIAIAQKIIDRVLFIAFAEDTGLLPRTSLNDAFQSRDKYNPRPVWDNFLSLFNAINEGSSELGIPRYNGGLFKSDTDIDSLKLSNGICEGFKSLGDYDFASEVSVTVLGRIFEQSITDVERLQAVARGEEEPEKVSGTTGRRKRDGVVYTPDYIARFIVGETIGEHIKEAFEDILRVHTKKNSDISNYPLVSWRSKASELNLWQEYRERLRSLRIVDPACGSGVFLIMAFDFLKAELIRTNNKIKELLPKAEHFGDLLDYVPDSEILTNNLFGVDVNEESVEITKLSLWIKTARRNKVLDSLDGNIRVGDSLIEDNNYAYLKHGFTWEKAFPQIFKEGKFDIVLGNPPYVRMEFLKLIKPHLEKRYEVVSDRADLYCYFYERGLKLLKPGGRLGYISSNTFFKTRSGRPLREYLLHNSRIDSVVDFGDLQIFEGVTTYPAIITLKQEPAPKNHQVRFWHVDKIPDTNFRASWEASAALFPQKALGTEPWELENANLRALRDKIRNGKPKLQEVYGSPLYGIKTGCNDAFVIDASTKKSLCDADPRSSKILKPFLEGKDLRRWRAESRDLWLIYTPKSRINIDDYPAVKKWLMPFKNQLEARATKQEWFELQQSQEAYAPHFKAEKISYPHFNSIRNFSFERSGAFSNDKSYLIPSNDLSLLALLNSRVLWFVISAMSPPVRGGYHELRVQYVQELPIPKMSKQTRVKLADEAKKASDAAIERLQVQRDFLRRIPDLNPSSHEINISTKLREWWTLVNFSAFRAEIKKSYKTDIPLKERSAWEDWIKRDAAKITRLSATIAQSEAIIDKCVYEIFELDDAEIALLEASI